MLFLALGNIDIQFIELENFSWKFYTIAEALPTINRVEFSDRKEFTNVVLDKNLKTIGKTKASFQWL